MLVNSATTNGFGNGEKTFQTAVKQSETGGDKIVVRQDALFERVSARLKAQVGPDVYASWFGRLKLHSVSKSVVRLSVPTTFLKSWINNRYLDLITSLVQQEDADVLKVEILVRTATRGARPGTQDEVAPSVISDAASSRILAPQFRPAGRPCTQRPRSAVSRRPPLSQARSSVRRSMRATHSTASSRAHPTGWRLPPPRPLPKPVPAPCASTRCSFIRASALARRICCRRLPLLPSRARAHPRVVYLTAEYFMWRFATAIRDNDALSLKETLRNIDLLVIDDMQFLQGKSIQHEFCHLLNMLLDSAKQVVVAADRAPWELESLDPRVRSRLQGGVAIEMDGPDYEMRLEILKRRLDSRAPG